MPIRYDRLPAELKEQVAFHTVRLSSFDIVCIVRAKGNIVARREDILENAKRIGDTVMQEAVREPAPDGFVHVLFDEEDVQAMLTATERGEN